MIDGKSMAAGGIGPHTELSARIPSGPGAGDRIVVQTHATIPFFRCQIFAEPKGSLPTISPPPGDSAEPAESPVESEAVRRARASWFGRRSERFRTLLPAGLIFLELVLILASFAGWPSPWLEMTWHSIPHKHGDANSGTSYAFHPLTFAFLLFVTGWVCAFLAARLSNIDHLIRYGRRFRELRKDIRRQAKLKIFGSVIVAVIAPTLIAGLFEVISAGGTNRVAAVIYTEFRLGPNSKAYDELLIDMPFYSHFENGVEHCRRPNQWDMAIGLKTKDSAEPVTMDIEMPSLHASYVPSWSKSFEMPIVLDIDELTKWMSDLGKLDVKEEKVKKEAAELMALLKRFGRQAPANLGEYMDAETELMPDFRLAGSRGWPGKMGSFSPMNGDWFTGIYLASAVIFLALCLVVVPRIQRAAFALDREVRERGESVLTPGPLPRVKFGALPRDILVRTIRRAALVGVGLLLLPAVAALWESTQPKRVKDTYHYQLDSESKFYHKITMSFAFESYERDGEMWFIQPHPLRLELAFTSVKNFVAGTPLVDQHLDPTSGLPEGTTHSFTVDLPGLHATSPYYPDGVTLDAEELERWLRGSFLPQTFPQPEDPGIKRDTAALMAFLKLYATQAPSTRLAFLAAMQKMGLQMPGSTGVTTREYSGQNLVAPIPALAAAIVIFLALLPLLKRSAVRAAVRQGTLNTTPQSPAPEEEGGAGKGIIAGKPRLSRLALWGAIWAPLFFITAIFFISRTASIDASGRPYEPSEWQILLRFTLLPLGALAPFGTTILGAVAVGQIKRSGGQLYGLRLAAVDVLLFPLIALFLIVVVTVNVIASHIL